MATQHLPPPPLSLPHYPELIFAAIDAIDEKNGANKSTISKHIEATYGNLPAAHSTLLSHHLNKMKAAGQLIMVKNNYVKPDPDAPPRRGRGRPPKSKQPLPPDAVLSPPKPRGRPPKPRDSLAPNTVTPTPSVSGRKRGRPPKLGSSTTKAPPPAASGERRGRGRPPKVKASVAAAPVGA